MSQKDTAFNQIKRYGSKGDVILINKTITNNPDDLKVTSSESRVSLLAYVGRIPSNKDQNARRTGIKVLAAIDKDFDGSVNVGASIEYLGNTLDVTDYWQHRVNNEIAYVELICNG